MILGINGRIGSGKDTIGKIIQYLIINNNRNKVDKISFEKFLINDKIGIYNKVTNWEIKKFATKVKEIATLLTGIPTEKFEDQDFKNTFLDDNWNKEVFENKTSLDKDNNAYKKSIVIPMTVREMLQTIGTEAMRNSLHPNTWVNALMCYYIKSDDKLIRTTEDLLEEWEEGSFPNWIITDLRFPNEMQSIKANGGITIKVVRPNDKKVLLDLHSSETALDEVTFDYEIINDGTMPELINKVQKMLKNFNLI